MESRMVQVLLFALSLAVVESAKHARKEADYKPCHTGKGKPKLYNCGAKYNPKGDRRAHLSSLSSPTRYMVKLKDGTNTSKVDEICSKAETNKTAYPGYCTQKYKKVWVGMLMVISGEQLSRLLDQERDVIDHVEVEGTARVSATAISMTATNVTETNPPSWGLDRIDHQPNQAMLNNLYTVTSGGDGVHVYILDTGIRCTHQDFDYQDGRLDKNKIPLSRCLAGFDGIRDGYGTFDCNGHGTHCAGVVAGLQSGVAKNAFVHPVRAMACDGTGGYGVILAALDWISKNAILPAVVSMSIAATASISIDQAVNNLINTTGILAVVAAGNFKQDTCNYSPARAKSVMAVGSVGSNNAMSWFSNYGVCTTIFAPGELIVSAWNTSDTAYATLSGTSMACPHVAGATALFLGQNADARPQDVRQSLLDSSEPSAVSGVQPNTTTKLLNVNLKQPFFFIHPRSFYNTFEGTIQTSVVSLRIKPSSIVMLTPSVDPTIGYFQPGRLYFATDSSWSMAQSINFVLVNRTDFLDHSSIIQWAFSSQDTRFVSSPEGYASSFDTAICKWSAANPCGQTADLPKVIPSLPFFYIENSMKYQNVYDSTMDYCHNSAPDVVFQYIPTSDMIDNTFSVTSKLPPSVEMTDGLMSVAIGVAAHESIGTGRFVCMREMLGDGFHVLTQSCNVGEFGRDCITLGIILLVGQNVSVSLCGADTNFDTILSVYEKTGQGASLKLTLLACNDDSCGVQSAIPSVALIKNHTYVFIVDGWGTGGLFDFRVSQLTTSPSSAAKPNTLKTSSVRIVSSSLDDHASTRWNGRDSENLPPASTPQNSYFWSAVSWGPCDQACGGGTQHAVIKCYFGNYTEADPTKCAGLPATPQASQGCNVVECRFYFVYEGPWGECNKTCGSGIQKREVYCVDNLGNTAHPEDCVQYNQLATQRPCNMQACNGSYWDVPSWNFCNVPCAGGTQFRDIICQSLNGSVSDDHACSHQPAPDSEQICNSHPCQTYAWLVGPWSNCPDGCGFNHSRTVECVDGWGETAELYKCDTRKKPAGTMPCLRPDVICDNCMQNNCSGHGHCTAGQCVCSGSWEGLHCERLKACGGRPLGYLGNKVSCCPNQIVDVNQHCCVTRNATLTADGSCCEGGVLDVTGQCNGSAISVDSQGTGCSTIRDEKGICCSSGVLDECHICDGDSTSCATNITVNLAFNTGLGIPLNDSAEWKTFMFSFISTVASKLGVADDALLLTAVSLSDTYNGDCTDNSDREQGCLMNGSPEVVGTITFTVLPKPAANLQAMVIEKADVMSLIASISPPVAAPPQSAGAILSGPQSLNTTNEPIFIVQSMENVQRAGICGNGMCEKGERCDPSSKSAVHKANHTCCLKDCPYVSLTCPISITGPHLHKACGGNGICLDASGQCSCFLGYRGAACEHCMFGWKEARNGSVCVKLATAQEYTTMALSSTDPVELRDDMDIEVMGANHGLAIFMVLVLGMFVGILGCYLRRWWLGQHPWPHRHHRLSTDPGSPRGREGGDTIPREMREAFATTRTQHNEQVETAAAQRARTSLLEVTSSSSAPHAREGDLPQQRPVYGQSAPSSSGGTRMHSIDNNEGGNWSKMSLNPQQEKRNDLFGNPPSYESLEATDSGLGAKSSNLQQEKRNDLFGSPPLYSSLDLTEGGLQAKTSVMASQESKKVPSWLQPQPQLQVVNVPPREIVEVPTRKATLAQEAGPSQRRPFEAQKNLARSASPSPRSELLDLT